MGACARCGGVFRPTGRRIYCSDKCRHEVAKARKLVRQALAEGPVEALDLLPDDGERDRRVPVDEHGSDPAALRPPSLPWERPNGEPPQVRPWQHRLIDVEDLTGELFRHTMVDRKRLTTKERASAASKIQELRLKIWTENRTDRPNSGNRTDRSNSKPGPKADPWFIEWFQSTKIPKQTAMDLWHRFKTETNQADVVATATVCVLGRAGHAARDGRAAVAGLPVKPMDCAAVEL